MRSTSFFSVYFCLLSYLPFPSSRHPPVLVHMARAPAYPGADAPTRAATGRPLRDHQRRHDIVENRRLEYTRARTATAAAPIFPSLREPSESVRPPRAISARSGEKFPPLVPRAAGVLICQGSFDEVCLGIETLGGDSEVLDIGRRCFGIFSVVIAPTRTHTHRS